MKQPSLRDDDTYLDRWLQGARELKDLDPELWRWMQWRKRSRGRRVVCTMIVGALVLTPIIVAVARA